MTDGSDGERNSDTYGRPRPHFPGYSVDLLRAPISLATWGSTILNQSSRRRRCCQAGLVSPYVAVAVVIFPTGLPPPAPARMILPSQKQRAHTTDQGLPPH